MAEAILNKTGEFVDTTKDGIVIVNALGDIPGGRTLDVSGFTGVLKAGHVIIKTTSTGVYKPLAVTGTPAAYDTKDAGDEWVGVLKASIPVSDPRAAIVTIGQINAAACPYTITDTIKAGLPRIEFL